MSGECPDASLFTKMTFILLRMPCQTPSWTEFLICPICTNEFAANLRVPITLRCGHSICKKCLATIQQCPYDQVSAFTSVILQEGRRVRFHHGEKKGLELHFHFPYDVNLHTTPHHLYKYREDAPLVFFSRARHSFRLSFPFIRSQQSQRIWITCPSTTLCFN